MASFAGSERSKIACALATAGKINARQNASSGAIRKMRRGICARKRDIILVSNSIRKNESLLYKYIRYHVAPNKCSYYIVLSLVDYVKDVIPLSIFSIQEEIPFQHII